MTDDDFLTLAYDWATPVPDGIRHAMPDDNGVLPCCGREVHALPCGDAMTAGADRITCTGGR